VGQPSDEDLLFFMLAVGLPIICGAGTLCHAFLKRRKLAQRLEFVRGTPTSRIGDLQPGLQKVTGRLAAADRVLRSPLSDKRCVSWHVSAKRFVTSGSQQQWQDVYSFSDSCAAVLRDESGEIQIAEWTQHCEQETWTVGSLFRGRVPRNVVQRFEKRFRQSAKGLTISESVLATGGGYTAIGNVLSGKGRLKMTFEPTWSLLSSKPESDIVSEIRAQATTSKVHFVLSILVMLSPAGFLVSTQAGLYSMLVVFSLTAVMWTVRKIAESNASKTA
jgi:hypothetical protein